MRAYMHNNSKIMTAWFNRLWYGPQSASHRLLFPVLYVLSLLYRLLLPLFRRPPVLHNRLPVIVIGNLTVGGNGKTPCVIALVKLLQSWGFQPGVVTRGYGGSGPCVAQLIDAKSQARIVGDEPILIAQQTGCPVVVDPVRARGVRALEYVADIVVSDDGLQHTALARDFEVVVVNAQRGFGNECCLPAGPLREPLSRLASVDMVVQVGESDADYQAIPEVGLLRSLANGQSYPLNGLPFRQAHAVAGIAHPEQFFACLRDYLDITPHIFPDHHPFTAADLNFQSDLPIIVTEKDAVKLQALSLQQIWVLAWSVRYNQAAEAAFLKFLQKTATAQDNNQTYRAERVCSLLMKVKKLS